MAQRREVSGIVVTLSALELYHGGGGILRYLISLDSWPEPGRPPADYPELEVRDTAGRSYGWMPEGFSGGEGRVEGALKLYDLPGSGELEIRVPRLVRTEPPDGTVVEHSKGPWNFYLSL